MLKFLNFVILEPSLEIIVFIKKEEKIITICLWNSLKKTISNTVLLSALESLTKV